MVHRKNIVNQYLKVAINVVWSSKNDSPYRWESNSLLIALEMEIFASNWISSTKLVIRSQGRGGGCGFCGYS